MLLINCPGCRGSVIARNCCNKGGRLVYEVFYCSLSSGSGAAHPTGALRAACPWTTMQGNS